MAGYERFSHASFEESVSMTDSSKEKMATAIFSTHSVLNILISHAICEKTALIRIRSNNHLEEFRRTSLMLHCLSQLIERKNVGNERPEMCFPLSQKMGRQVGVDGEELYAPK